MTAKPPVKSARAVGWAEPSLFGSNGMISEGLDMVAISFTAESDRQARFRLAQARYFLELVRESGGNAPAFTYLMHALVATTRSIALVLQSDLRGTWPEFDVWWEAERQQLEDEELPFATVRDLRNLFEKEGSAIPARVYSLEMPDGPVHHVTYVWAGYGEPPEPFPPNIIAAVLVNSGMLTSFVHFREGHPATSALQARLAESAPHATVEMTAISAETAKRIERDGLRPRFIGYMLSPAGGPVVSLETIVGVFGRYLERVERLLDRADERFPFNRRIGMHPHAG
jgi:hypothetical protein